MVERIEALLERYRGSGERPSRAEIDRVHTDGCAAVLALEATRSETERALAAALTDGENDARSVQRARELALRSREVEREIAELAELVRHLRTAADWIRLPESADAVGAG